MIKILLFFIVFNFSFSYINIHPTRFDKPIDNNGSYQEFTLFNQSSNPILYRIYSEDEKNSKNSSMTKWMNFYPKTLTLKPGEMGKIQLSIASHGDLDKKEYTSVLGIREIPIFDEVVKSKGASLNIYTDLKLVLMGYGSGATPKLKIDSLNLLHSNDSIKLSGNIENIGERRGRYELFLGDNFLGNIRIMSKEKLKFQDFDFSFKKSKNLKIENTLIFKDYETKKIISKIKI